MATLFPAPQQYFDNSGDPLSGGLVYFYEAGTTTPKNTYTTSAATPGTENANPVVLNSSGRPTTGIWGSGSYKYIVKTSAGTTLETRDNVTLSGEAVTQSVLNEMNFVRNSSFIHQLAALPAAPSDNDYIFPNWRILMENASGVVPTFINNSSNTAVGADGITVFSYDRTRLTVGSGNNGKFGLFQQIENKDIHLLRQSAYASIQCALQKNSNSGIATVKMALLGYTGSQDTYTGDPISAWGADGTNPTLGAGWVYLNTAVNLSITTAIGRYKVEAISCAGSYFNYAILIWSDDRTTTQTTDWLEVSNVRIERGQSCSEYSRYDMATSVAACQRQYYAIAGDAKVIGNGGALTSTTAKIIMPFKTTMRAVPTLVAVSSAAHFTVDDGTGTPVACTAITLDAASTVDVAILSITTASGLTAGRATYLKTANASATMEFTARI